MQKRRLDSDAGIGRKKDGEVKEVETSHRQSQARRHPCSHVPRWPRPTVVCFPENFPFILSRAPPNLSSLRAAFCESDQISKQNTLATHFYTYNLVRNYTYNLVRKEELIPFMYSQRQTVVPQLHREWRPCDVLSSGLSFLRFAWVWLVKEWKECPLPNRVAKKN